MCQLTVQSAFWTFIHFNHLFILIYYDPHLINAKNEEETD